MTDFIVLASLFALTFFGGVIVGYALRAIVSIRRRERAAGRLRQRLRDRLRGGDASAGPAPRTAREQHNSIVSHTS